MSSGNGSFEQSHVAILIGALAAIASCGGKIDSPESSEGKHIGGGGTSSQSGLGSATGIGGVGTTVVFERICMPGQARCDPAGSNGVQRCSQDGVWDWAMPVGCENQTCIAGECVGECAPGQVRCAEKTPQSCSSTGFWQSESICTLDSICLAGICVPCPSNAGPSMVGLPLGYCIDSTELTRKQYFEWLSTQPSTVGQLPECDWNTSFTPNADWTSPPMRSDSPVTDVDYCDAQAYCKGIGKRLCGSWDSGTGTPISQWVAACTSNGKYTYPYGNAYSTTACNSADAGYAEALPVGTMADCHSPEAGYGEVYDLSGNVDEWTDDCQTISSNILCRVCGGDFGDDLKNVSPASNNPLACDTGSVYLTLTFTSPLVGFRCCFP